MDAHAIHSCSSYSLNSKSLVATFEQLRPAASKLILVRPAVSKRLDSTVVEYGFDPPP